VRDEEEERGGSTRGGTHGERSRARAWALNVHYRWEAEGGGTSLEETLRRTLKHRTVAPAILARELAAAVRQHLVHVHVPGGSGTGLKHVDRKSVVELSGNDVVGRRRNRLCALFVENAKCLIGQRGGTFELRQGPFQRVG